MKRGRPPGGSKYPFEQLVVGGSFTFPWNKVPTVRSYAHKLKRSRGWCFSITEAADKPGFYRCRRIAPVVPKLEEIKVDGPMPEFDALPAGEVDAMHGNMPLADLLPGQWFKIPPERVKKVIEREESSRKFGGKFAVTQWDGEWIAYCVVRQPPWDPNKRYRSDGTEIPDGPVEM